MTAIRTLVGPVNAPAAPVVIQGDELAAVQAMGAGAKYWRAMATAIQGQESLDFEWRSRIGDVPLRLARTGWPSFSAGGVEYLAWGTGGPQQGLLSPPGVEVLPYSSHTIVCTVYQGPSAEGVILGQRERMTQEADPENGPWEGLIVGSMGNPDDLTYMTRGQNHRVTAPDQMSFRDNLWHVITAVYEEVDPNATVNRAALRVDGSEIAVNNAIASPRLDMKYRELQVGMAGDEVAVARFLGRINSIAIIPGALDTQPERLAAIEGYFGNLVGAEMP